MNRGNQRYRSKNAEDTKELGKSIAASMQGGEVVCLSGELGAGKTTFVQGFIEYFLPKKRILSPTFTIVRHYNIEDTSFQSIYHLDLYQLREGKQIEDLGVSEFLHKPDSVTLIEWAEKMKRIPVKKKIQVRLSIADNNDRIINVMSNE